ncbi:isochorismatase family protein [Nonomuraea sp. NPDC001023]|uniref:isochorismatase family protein n=1 Tax=unclassified Nonomuraea TaxID=2593643 RepID=UPI00332C2F38
MPVVSEIEPYPMPDAAELPPAAVTWTPDPRRAVLLLVDLQHACLDLFPPGEAPLTDLVRNVTALRELCARLGVPVAYAAQPGLLTGEQQGLARDFWRRSDRLEPARRGFPEPMAPGPGDWIFTRRRYSAFHETTLLWWLRESGRDQLLIAGVYAHIGVLTTALDAFTHDIQPYVVADAVADLTAADHRQALGYVAGRCGVTLTTKQLLAGLPRNL